MGYWIDWTGNSSGRLVEFGCFSGSEPPSRLLRQASFHRGQDVLSTWVAEEGFPEVGKLYSIDGFEGEPWMLVWLGENLREEADIRTRSHWPPADNIRTKRKKVKR